MSSMRRTDLELIPIDKNGNRNPEGRGLNDSSMLRRSLSHMEYDNVDYHSGDMFGISMSEDEDYGFVSRRRKKKDLKVKHVSKSFWTGCWGSLSSCWQKLHITLPRKQLKPRILTLADPLTPMPLGVTNVICNQKYNVFTFLPIVLFEQFSFFFNFYFLVVALSQFITPLKIGYLYTYWGPLIFVLAVTISKEAFDDWLRYTRDKEVNQSKYIKVTVNGEVEITSADIKVGDIIKVHTNERVPADLLFLRTTETAGASFIRTDQLDGETDWKLRVAVTSCQKYANDQCLFEHHSSVYADKPTKDIHTFIGNFTSYPRDSSMDPATEPLSVDNMLWTNTVVASGVAVGMVIYTGKETRSVMNTSQPRTKIGILDQEINLYAKVLFVLTMLLAFILVALKGLNGAWYIYIFRFVLLFSYIIPISLRVNLDMAKTWYNRQMMKDNAIPNMVVRTSTIPEELGRIRYLLTDKTGTLTQNEMVFRKLHLGTVSFGVETQDDIRQNLCESFVTPLGAISSPSGQHEAMEMDYLATHQTSPFNQPRNRLSSEHQLSVNNFTAPEQFLLTSPGLLTSTSNKVKNMLLAIGLCHNVTPLVNESGSIEYQAASPDEVALVGWAATVGLGLVARDLTSMSLQGPSNERLSYTILNIFPFTSESKRMGIVVREDSTGKITFYCKGADTIMTTLVQYNDWLVEECDNMAREGLRTLVFARRCLTNDEYELFSSQMLEAKCSVMNRDEAVMKVRSTLEKEMEVLGLTGVEDKLQEDIKPTLETLRNAGIKIWMLTGDKMETATNIAIASRLVSRTQSIYCFRSTISKAEIERELEIFREQTDCALVIDGKSLQLCIDNYEAEFMELATAAPAVVCCRCAPTQKADIVRLIGSYTKLRTLAIGDGGNDVSMIQAADIGVGLEGKEGRQASLAADYSMTKFKHLSRLLLYHGRNSYQRSAALAQFVVHRGLIISVMQAVFSAVFYFSAIALYQGILMVGYTTVYTMLPVFSLVLDEDVSCDIAMLYPELYKDLTKGRSLTLKTFFLWLLVSTYQGGVIMLGALLLFEEGEFVNIVSISFTSLILTELLMVALTLHRWHWAMILSEIVSLGIYIGSVFVLKNYFDVKFILTVGFFWRVGAITLVSFVPLYVGSMIYLMVSPPSYKKLS